MPAQVREVLHQGRAFAEDGPLRFERARHCGHGHMLLDAIVPGQVRGIATVIPIAGIVSPFFRRSSQ
jgi:hypothetical protein